MITPRLTKNAAGDYDLQLENGVLGPMCEEGTQAAQHSLERLLIFQGELSLDGALTTKTTGGTRWYETIFAMDVPRAEKELEIKSRILGTPGIIKILSFTWTQAAHTVTITGRVLTAWGEEDISGTISPL
jgi:hypothetical protein